MQFFNFKKHFLNFLKNLSDLYHGFGILCDVSGNISEGDWKDGYLEGIGHFRFFDGGSYIGNFVKSVFEGKVIN